MTPPAHDNIQTWKRGPVSRSNMSLRRWTGTWRLQILVSVRGPGMTKFLSRGIIARTEARCSWKVGLVTAGTPCRRDFCHQSQRVAVRFIRNGEFLSVSNSQSANIAIIYCEYELIHNLSNMDWLAPMASSKKLGQCATLSHYSELLTKAQMNMNNCQDSDPYLLHGTLQPS